METNCSEGSEEISLDLTITKKILMHLAFLLSSSRLPSMLYTLSHRSAR
jgi:hypothetical protein